MWLQYICRILCALCALIITRSIESSYSVAASINFQPVKGTSVSGLQMCDTFTFLHAETNTEAIKQIRVKWLTCDGAVHACASVTPHTHSRVQKCTHTLTPLPHSSAMTWCPERTDVHADLSAWSNERAAWKRRVPVTGRLYSPLPRSESWSSRWAGRRCFGKER